MRITTVGEGRAIMLTDLLDENRELIDTSFLANPFEAVTSYTVPLPATGTYILQVTLFEEGAYMLTIELM